MDGTVSYEKGATTTTTTSSPHWDGAKYPIVVAINSQMPPFSTDNSIDAPLFCKDRPASSQAHSAWLQSGQAMGQGQTRFCTFCDTATGTLQARATMKANVGGYSIGSDTGRTLLVGRLLSCH